MENYSVITYSKKTKKHIIDFFILPLMGIFIVFYLSSFKCINFKYIFYSNNYILVDYWFFIHILNTFICVLFYPYKLSIKDLWFFVIGWEIIENILMPEIVIPSINYNFNMNYNLTNFSESLIDLTGDLIAPIPATLFLYYKNN
tara:strand:+ start:10049 stop:10480 length:432 start_codon:yes stop_codon:yes gene_type:complete